MAGIGHRSSAEVSNGVCPSWSSHGPQVHQPHGHTGLRLSRTNVEDTSQGPGQRALEGGTGQAMGAKGDTAAPTRALSSTVLSISKPSIFLQTSPADHVGSLANPCRGSVLLQIQHGYACMALPSATQRYPKRRSWQRQH